MSEAEEYWEDFYAGGKSRWSGRPNASLVEEVAGLEPVGELPRDPVVGPVRGDHGHPDLVATQPSRLGRRVGLAARGQLEAPLAGAHADAATSARR